MTPQLARAAADYAATGCPRPYRVDDLARRLRVSTWTEFASLVRVHRRTLDRWRHYGLTAAQADHLAIMCGYHPTEVWSSWA